MSQGKKVDMTEPIGNIEDAVRGRDWNEARFLMAIRLGRMMDATDSARDAKAIAMSLTPMVDKLEAFDNAKNDAESTTDADIVRRAKEARERYVNGDG